MSMNDFANEFDPSDSEPENTEDYQIAKRALDLYVNHNKLGRTCLCKGCSEMRLVYAQVMKHCREQDEGEEWKGEGIDPNGLEKI